jgi:TolB-like protein/DNA-binding winged helix-turn-helix (wHTH) protein
MHKQVKLGEHLVNPELLETELLLCDRKPSGILRPQEVPAAVSPGIVKFEEFELDCNRYQLLRAGRRLKLEQLPMELLILLLDKDGHLVTRDEIVDRLWGKDVFVDTEHGINTAIRKIRNVLRDDAETPRFVQTVTGRGYRFVAPINLIAQEHGNGNYNGTESAPLDTTQTQNELLAPRSLPQLNHRVNGFARKASLVLIGAIGIAAILVGLNVGRVHQRLFAHAGESRIHSLAVLPLENLSGDPAQEYFADGMTDELITMLAKHSDLRVISRTSVMQYKKAHRPLREIAGQLGVDGVLEGSVVRSGGRVHVNAQLVYAPDERHIWAESYDRNINEAMSIPADLSQTIVQKLKKAAGPATSPKYVSPEAHDAYLRGRYLWFASDDNEESRKYFEKAIQLQPDYAAAWSGLADSYAAQAVEWQAAPQQLMERAEWAARHALELDDSVPEAHNSLAGFYLFGKWELKNADAESARAIELNPNFAEAHHLRAYILMAMQRPDEALLEEKRSSELDPLLRPWGLGYVLIRLHRIDDAMEDLRMKAAAQPRNSYIRFNLSDAYWFKGMWDDAIREAEAAFLDDGDKKSAQELRRAFDSGGHKGAAEWWVKHAKSQDVNGYISPLALANNYAQAENKQEALRCLEQAYGEHSSKLVFLQNNPVFDFLHSDARYRALVKKVGLPPAY